MDSLTAPAPPHTDLRTSPYPATALRLGLNINKKTGVGARLMVACPGVGVRTVLGLVPPAGVLAGTPRIRCIYT